MNNESESDQSKTSSESASSDVIMYWRPGCGFCAALERRLRTAEVNYSKRNIWENPDDAAYVRSVARGNETVPTLVVGGTPMVNPSLEDVLAHLA